MNDHQFTTPVDLAARNGQGPGRDTVHETIEDAGEATGSRTDAVKARALQATEMVAAQVSVAAAKVAQAAADPEKRRAARLSVQEHIRENPWLAAFGAFTVGLRVGRRLPRH